MQTDIPASKPRSLGFVAIGLGFVAVCVAYLLYGPRGGRLTSDPRDLVMWLGIVLGLLGIGVGVHGLLRTGPVVSVGPRGVFDRRLSTGWIPWSAVRGISTATVQRNSFVMLDVDPAQDALLPITRRARLLARANAGMGLSGYAISAGGLVGGFPALVEAFERARTP